MRTLTRLTAVLLLSLASTAVGAAAEKTAEDPDRTAAVSEQSRTEGSDRENEEGKESAEQADEPAAPEHSFSGFGPLRVTNLSALSLPAMQPWAWDAAGLGEGERRFELGADLANQAFTSSGSGSNAATLDYELYRLAPRYSAGLTDRLTVGAELPLYHRAPGFLDSIIDSWHRFFGLPTGDRDDLADFRTDIDIAGAGGEQLVDMKGAEFSFGDPVVGANYRLTPSRRHALSARLFADLPLGKERELFSDGEPALGVGLGGRTASGRWRFYGSADVVFRPESRVGTARGAEGLLTDTTGVSASAAAEYISHRRLTWLAQLELGTSPTDAPVADRADTALVGALAARFRPGSGAPVWTVGFSEDLTVGAAPDFTGFASVRFSW